MARVIFGADKHIEGEIFINGKRIDIKDPLTAIKNGIAYLSEDRKRFGLAVNMAMDINIALANMAEYTGFMSFIKAKQIEANANQKSSALDIKTPSVKQLVNSCPEAISKKSFLRNG